MKCKSNLILTLRNVFPKSTFIEDMMETRIMGKDSMTPSCQYDKLPSQFISLDAWPKHTNLWCCWCSLSYAMVPIPYPKSIERSSQTVLTYTVDIDSCLQFHSFNCLVAYITANAKDASERVNKISMVYLLYKIFNNVTTNYITPAISPLLMTRYGGDLSEADYKHIIETSDKAFAKDVTENSFAVLCKAYCGQKRADEDDDIDDVTF